MNESAHEVVTGPLYTKWQVVAGAIIGSFLAGCVMLYLNAQQLRAAGTQEERPEYYLLAGGVGLLGNLAVFFVAEPLGSFTACALLIGIYVWYEKKQAPLVVDRVQRGSRAHSWWRALGTSYAVVLALLVVSVAAGLGLRGVGLLLRAAGLF